MKFKLSIDTSNAAFHEDVNPENWELARILRELADRVESGDVSPLHQNLRDANGNIVGTYALKEDWS